MNRHIPVVTPSGRGNSEKALKMLKCFFERNTEIRNLYNSK